jgi:DNA-binding SARP family transcriptional activator
MARAAVKAKQAAKPKQRPQGRRRHAAGGNPNQQLFFMRLRRQAKWIYVLLAVLFAITFAFLGVGSGSSGLDQLFSNLNIFGHGGRASVSKAQDYIKDHPNAAKGYRDLATAYEAKGDTGNAASALQQYLNIRQKDAKAWSELAGLQATQAQDYLQQYQGAYQARQLAAPSEILQPAGKLAQANGTNPIEQAQAQVTQARVNDLQTRVQLAFQNVVLSWQHVTKLRPSDDNAWLQLAQAAQTSGQASAAANAYRHYLKLNPDSPSAPQIKQLIEQLSPSKKK